MKYYNYPNGTKVAVDLDSENTSVVKGPDGKYLVPNELPAITPEDAGKVVKVKEDGTGIEYGEAGEDVFVVTFTNNGGVITMDVSGDDLVSAIKDGKYVYGKLDSDVYNFIKFTDAYQFQPAIIEFVKINVTPSGYAFEKILSVEAAFYGTSIQYNEIGITSANIVYDYFFRAPDIVHWNGPSFDSIYDAVSANKLVFAAVNEVIHSMTILSAYTMYVGELTSVEFTSLDGTFSLKKGIGDDYYTRIERIPECPITTDGSFVLKATVSNGTVTYSWVAES